MKKAVLAQILRLADRNIGWNQYYQDNSHLVHGVPQRPGENNTFQSVLNSLEEDKPNPPPAQTVPPVTIPNPTQPPQNQTKDLKDWVVPILAGLLLGSLLLLGTGAAGTYLFLPKDKDTPIIDPPAIGTDLPESSRRSLLQSLEDGGYHVGGRESS